MIAVHITHIGQNLDLKRKVFEHTLQLTLPDGSVIVARVDESAVEKLMAHVASAGDVVPELQEREEPASASGEFHQEAYDGQLANIFGGGSETTDTSSAPGQLDLPAEQPRPQVQPPQPTRIKTVPKDEYGYPLVPASGVGAEQVLAGNVEDDGVPQL